MKRLLLLVAGCVGVALAYLKAYEVPPTQAGWSGKVDGDPQFGGVENTFVASFDSICEVQFFAGDIGDGGQYRVDVLEYPEQTLIARSAQVAQQRSHTWVKFDSWDISGKFTRGKTYLAKVVRPNDSINFYWSESVPGGPYQYGEMLVGGAPQANRDLCMRLTAMMRPVDSAFLGCNMFPWVSGLTPAQWADVNDAAVEAGVGTARTEIPWSWVERSQGQFDFDREGQSVDLAVDRIQGELGCEMIGLLAYGTKWASTRITLLQGSPDHYDTSEHCPPKNLFEPVFVSAGGPGDSEI